MQLSLGLHEDKKTGWKDRNLDFQVARAQQSIKREPHPLSLRHKWSTVPTPTKGLLEGTPELIRPSQGQHQGALRAWGTAFLKSAPTVYVAFPVDMPRLRCCYLDHCPGTRCSQLKSSFPRQSMATGSCNPAPELMSFFSHAGHTLRKNSPRPGRSLACGRTCTRRWLRWTLRPPLRRRKPRGL